MTKTTTPTKAAAKRRPKIAVSGHSVLEGRTSTLLRIRPTLLRRLREASIGTTYLAIEYAVEELVKRAEAGEEIWIYADDMSPSQEDRKLCDEAESAKEAAKLAKASGPKAKKTAAA